MTVKLVSGVIVGRALVFDACFIREIWALCIICAVSWKSPDFINCDIVGKFGTTAVVVLVENT